MRPPVLRAIADVARSAAAALAALTPLERQLRTLAAVLDDGVGGGKNPPRRTPAAPRSTVGFTELDSKRAERALARHGIRSTK